MKKVTKLISAALVSLALAASAHAATVTFDEVPVYTSNPTINGVSFWAGDPSSFHDTYVDNQWSSTSNYLASGVYDGNTAGLYDTMIGVTLASHTQSIFFNILSEKGLPDETTFTVLAFLGDALKGSTTLTVQDNNYHGIALNAGTDIDKLIIYDDMNSFGYGEAFHIDDFGFRTAPAPDTVPEPSTMLLFGSGLAAAMLWKRKKIRG